MAIEDKLTPHGLPSFSKLKTATPLEIEKLKELMGKVNEEKRPDFEKKVTSDEFTTKMADKVFSDYGKGAFHVLFIRLSPNALLSLLEKVSAAVLKDIFKGTENEIELFERKMRILEKDSEKKNIKSWKDRFDALRIKAEELPVKAGDFDEQPVPQMSQAPQAPQGTLENPAEFIPHEEEVATSPEVASAKAEETETYKVIKGTLFGGGESIPPEVVSPDEEAEIKAAKAKEIAKASVLIDDIATVGYSVVPFSLEERKIHHLENLEISDLKNVILDLEELKKYIEEIREEFANKTIPGSLKEALYYGKIIPNCGYRLVPIRQKTSNKQEHGTEDSPVEPAVESAIEGIITKPGAEVEEEPVISDEIENQLLTPQEKEVFTRFSNYLEIKYPKLAHPELEKEEKK